MREYTLSEVNYALADIKETLHIWRDAPEGDAYVAKLWREWDEMLDRKRELTRRG